MLNLLSQMGYDIDFLYNELYELTQAETKKEMALKLKIISNKAADMKKKVNARGTSYITETWEP